MRAKLPELTLFNCLGGLVCAFGVALFIYAIPCAVALGHTSTGDPAYLRTRVWGIFHMFIALILPVQCGYSVCKCFLIGVAGGRTLPVRRNVVCDCVVSVLALAHFCHRSIRT